ncbi:MAG: CopG family transcriptional regulator [Gemmatimonadales bacterium]
MELSKKTTILFTPELHGRLKAVARQRGTSIGALVREACVAQYGLVGTERRRTAVDQMAALALPVACVRDMKQESVPDPDMLLP